MDYIKQHIHNAKDWQLEKALEELKKISSSTQNTVVKNIADFYTNAISLERHNRNSN